MTDFGNGRGPGQQAAVPSPSCIRPRRAPGEQAAPGAAGRIPPARGTSVAPAAAYRAGQHGAALAGQGITLAAEGSGRVAADGSGRMAVRAELADVLAGVDLAGRDRQFLAKLVHWDKRNALSVVSLLRRARQAGRDETALTPRQLEVVLAALGDAARYRSSEAASVGCWDCENVPTGRCAEHAKDNDRARAYTELAAAVAAVPVPGGPDGMPEPRDIAGYRRPQPVAS
jgi:hypothetical protein